MSFHDLTGQQDSQQSGSSNEIAIDLIAVPGIDEDAVGAWTHQDTGKLWLRDLLKQAGLYARILSFGYNADVLSASGKSSSDRLLSYSTTLVSSLVAERKLAKSLKRPIVFVCHGVGGILVKKALVISHSGSRRDVDRRSIFLSTCAVLFFGTPHKGLSAEAAKLYLPKGFFTEPSQLIQAALYDSEILQEVTDQFSAILNTFIIWCFWEQKKTQTKNGYIHIVDQESASMMGEDVQRSGLPTNHAEMCKFSDMDQPGFHVILAALIEIFNNAPTKVRERWREGIRLVKETLRNEEKAVKEAQALLRSDSWAQTPDSPQGVVNEYFLVPRPAVNNFTGLEQFSTELQTTFYNSMGKIGNVRNEVFVIYGIGGSGKTQFCLKFVSQVQSRFWGIFWIDASTHESLRTGFSNIGREAQKNATLEAGKYWLSCSSKHWLLVLDNADDPSIDISQYFPSGRKGYILITTRNNEVCMNATLGSKKLWEMDPSDAITLLLKSASLPGSKDYADIRKRQLAQPITDIVGRLALALTHAGAAIRRNICSLETYDRLYSSHWREVMKSSESKHESDYRCTIRTTWEIPFRKISGHKSSPHVEAVEIIQLFAFFHFQQIPASIFKRAWTNLQRSRIFEKRSGLLRALSDIILESGTHDLTLMNQKTQFWDSVLLVEALNLLTSYGLMEYDSISDTCTLHPVVQDWARDRLTTEQQHYWLKLSTCILADSISSNLEPSGRIFRRSIKLHIDVCISRWTHYNIAFPVNQPQAEIATKFAAIYAENGLWIQARDILQKSADVQAKLFGKTNTMTLKTMSDLGHCYWNLDDRKRALEIHQTVYETRAKTLKSKDPHLYKSMVDLTRSSWLNGQLERSKKMGELAVAGLMDVLGDADIEVLSAKHNLGRTYLHLGLARKASVLLSETLHLRERFFGTRHPETLETMNELGMSYYSLGNLEMARELVSQALRLRTNVLGEHHAYTLWSVNDLSKILTEQGDALQAKAMLEAIIPVIKETLGSSHVGMMMTRANLARTNMAMGDLEAAEDCWRNLTQIQTRNHPDWFRAMCGLSKTLEELHKYTQAEKTWKEAISSVLSAGVLSVKHRDVQNAIKSLKQILERGGRSQEVQLLELDDYDARS